MIALRTRGDRMSECQASIYISLMNKYTGQFSNICWLIILLYLFLRTVFSSLLVGWFRGLSFNFCTSLYIIVISPLSDVQLVKIFLFTLVTLSLTEQKLFYVSSNPDCQFLQLFCVWLVSFSEVLICAALFQQLWSLGSYIKDLIHIELMILVKDGPFFYMKRSGFHRTIC